MKINEDNFIGELKTKNKNALDYLVDNYSNLIFKVVISVLSNRNREDAMECLNDIVFKVWQNIKSYDEQKGRFSSWLIAVSKYTAIDYKRKLSKAQDVCDMEDINLTNSENIEDHILSNENSKELIKAIYEMGKPDSDIFIRRYFIGESINDICEKLSLSRTAVDNRLSRGRKFLKEKLTSIEKEVI